MPQDEVELCPHCKKPVLSGVEKLVDYICRYWKSLLPKEISTNDFLTENKAVDIAITVMEYCRSM